jgi:hypothetical protein
MKIYNKTTRELFGFINLEPPTIFRRKPNQVKIKFQKYIYLFPQKVYVIGNCIGKDKKGNQIFQKKAIYYWFWFLYIEVNFIYTEKR